MDTTLISTSRLVEKHARRWITVLGKRAAVRTLWENNTDKNFRFAIRQALLRREGLL